MVSTAGTPSSPHMSSISKRATLLHFKPVSWVGRATIHPVNRSTHKTRQSTISPFHCSAGKAKISKQIDAKNSSMISCPATFEFLWAKLRRCEFSSNHFPTFRLW